MTQESDTAADSPEAEPPVDVSAAIAAQVFGDVPIVGPDWLRSSIAMQANFAQLLPGATALSAAELNGPRTRADREEQEARETSHRMMDVVEEAERQREEWARTSHSFGTTTMSGEQWHDLSADLEGGGAVRTWLLAQIMADGHTRAEAERIADRARNVADIMATPEAQRTPEQRRELSEANRDPELRQYVEAAADYSRTLHRDGLDRNQTTETASTDTSLEVRTAALENFPNAPALGTEFRTAQAATVSPDGRRAVASASTAPTPQPVIASGFDV
ncbi:MAG TPA: hypothetical protein VGW40_13645 [Allosphingosinicella sp.]|nr:hypothetical protein [Allosphingosinicella sp.]